jgi:cell volume regulation protein A
VDEARSSLTLADYFDINLDHAPKEGATVDFGSIVLVARSISGGRVNIVGLRLPEDENDGEPSTRIEALRRRLSELWSSVAGA